MRLQVLHVSLLCSCTLGALTSLELDPPAANAESSRVIDDDAKRQKTKNVYLEDLHASGDLGDTSFLLSKGFLNQDHVCFLVFVKDNWALNIPKTTKEFISKRTTLPKDLKHHAYSDFITYTTAPQEIQTWMMDTNTVHFSNDYQFKIKNTNLTYTYIHFLNIDIV